MSRTPAPTTAQGKRRAPGTGLAVGFAALITALAVALAAHAATVLAFFIGNGMQAPALVQVSDYFVFSTLITLVLLFVGGVLGAFRRWYWALLAGFLAAVIGALLGSAINVLAQGNPFSGEVVGYLLASLVSLNLTFIVFVTLGTVTFGRLLFRALIARRGAGSPLQVALVRIPGTAAEVDRDLADQQWDDFVALLAAEGRQPVEIDRSNDDQSVFLGDSVVVIGGTGVIASVVPDGERADLEATLRDLRLVPAVIPAPAALDGGDVLVAGDTVYVGRGTHTNTGGIRALRAIAGPLGYTVVPVPLTGAARLSDAVGALPDGTLLTHAGSPIDTSLFCRFLTVPDRSGTQVVSLSDDAVLVPASAPGTAQLLEDLGYRVARADVGEFEKLGGGLSRLAGFIG